MLGRVVLEDVGECFGEPDSRNLWAEFGVFKLVGGGVKTKGNCGCFAGFQGCVREDLHNLVTLDGDSFVGKVFVGLKHRSCFNYRCPVCYLSWANREARKASRKLEVLSKVFGEVVHLTLSVPQGLYGLVESDFDGFMVKVRRALRDRWVKGGFIIFHGFRYADHVEASEKGLPFGWRWSPHFHVVGFVNKGALFESVPKMFLKDGFVLKLLDKRKTVYGTLWYQLNHASYRTDVKRFSIIRSFGVCKTEKVDLPEEEPLKCPICRHECVSLHYMGYEFGKLAKNADQCGSGDRYFLSDLRCVDGSQQWIEKEAFGKCG